MTDRGETALLSLDIGTTHCKAALFGENGRLIRLARTETVKYAEDGWEFYDPERLWAGIAGLIREAMPSELAKSIRCVGITSMAETGLLVDRRTGAARTPFIPWFSPCSKPQAEQIAASTDPLEQFAATGLRSSYKYGLAKILWWKQRDPGLLKGAVWLSASDYAAYRLTGALATDYTLAARTYAFRIDRKQWDAVWIRHFGLDTELFPEALPSGAVMGKVNEEAARSLGLPAGVPVVIAGHDHVAASLAAGAVKPGRVMDSIGTAETLVGVMPERKLAAADLDAGLSFGCHPIPGLMFWMGGLSASGGSVEWLRAVLSEPALSYDRLLAMLDETAPGPTGILYFPYLSGSGAPQPDAEAKAAFIGLAARHGRVDLLKAVLEGTAYEMEWMRRSAELAAGSAISALTVTGGGVQNRHWLQIKADVSNCPLELSDTPESALLGSAMLAGTGCGLFRDAFEAEAAMAGHRKRSVIRPQADYHHEYRRLFETGYVPLQMPLRRYHHNIEKGDGAL
ncbi:carbohydrate kinase [Cohnella pontilimi]|uniref:Carbohydrate kinase n=1 Tax=Cohnella pontilimi TaxID=2564100 RepID=A0A4U0FGP1_9BACL|nr:FGGY family carbohydrate kinase [Cohnella pontilimi]TJY43564.1 carbohydrate kinase [Cohnella pontilimi]